MEQSDKQSSDYGRITPRGLSRSQAASYIGVSAAAFDDLVRSGRMPRPKRIGTQSVWDLRLLDCAFEALDEDTAVGSRRTTTDSAIAEKPAPSEKQSGTRREPTITPSPPATIEHGGIIEYLTEGELAERWGISVQKLRKDRLTGKGIAFAKFGRAVRYAVKTVLKYEASIQRTNTAAGRIPPKIQRP